MADNETEVETRNRAIEALRTCESYALLTYKDDEGVRAITGIFGPPSVVQIARAAADLAGQLIATVFELPESIVELNEKFVRELPDGS